jgi:hypothetical protein
MVVLLGGKSVLKKFKNKCSTNYWREVDMECYQKMLQKKLLQIWICTYELFSVCGLY